MIVPQPWDQAPDFSIDTTDGPISLADLTSRGKVILAFYAEDATPLCSTQVSMLKDDIHVIREFGATVLAISADNLDSHRAFIERLGGLPFPLASDESLEVARSYGVADEPANRCHRAVFVVDETGMVLFSQPWYQPANTDQYAAIFRSLGLEV